VSMDRYGLVEERGSGRGGRVSEGRKIESVGSSTRRVKNRILPPEGKGSSVVIRTFTFGERESF